MNVALKDIVQDVMEEGAQDFPAVLAAVHALRDSRMVPLLNQMGDDLDNRLFVVCTRLSVTGTVVPGAAHVATLEDQPRVVSTEAEWKVQQVEKDAKRRVEEEKRLATSSNYRPRLQEAGPL